MSAASSSSSASSSSQLKQVRICGTTFELEPKYEPIRCLGSGSYGFVCSALNKETQEKIAIKKIANVFQNPVDAKRVLREIKLLRHFKNENILQLKDIRKPKSRTDFEDVYIMTELMDTDLQQVIRSRQPLTDEHFQYFIYQVFRGLKCIHSAKVLHRDLKPSNLLVNGSCDLKICDFGLARGFRATINQDMTEYVVTRWYRAPEVILLCPDYDEAVDVWSVGCILAELVNRKPLFPGRDYLDQLKLIYEFLGTPSEEDMLHITSQEASQYLRSLPKKDPKRFEEVFPTATPRALDLLRKVLVFHPRKRITVEQALAHPYFETLHDPSDEPACKVSFNFDYEKPDIPIQELKELLWQEMSLFHPEDARGGASNPYI